MYPTVGCSGPQKTDGRRDLLLENAVFLYFY
jgi:hypothetical protein